MNTWLRKHMKTAWAEFRTKDFLNRILVIKKLCCSKMRQRWSFIFSRTQYRQYGHQTFCFSIPTHKTLHSSNKTRLVLKSCPLSYHKSFAYIGPKVTKFVVKVLSTFGIAIYNHSEKPWYTEEIPFSEKWRWVYFYCSDMKLSFH